MFRILKVIGSKLEQPTNWCVAVFYAARDGHPEKSAGHCALVESTPAARLPGDAHAGTVLLPKDREERPYRGDFSEFVAKDSRGNHVPAPATRPGRWDDE